MPFLRLLADVPGFSREDMQADRRNCMRFGPCGLGGKAVWLGGFLLERTGCIPAAAVRRIYKRVAMSRGGFTGRGVFGSIPYLVVEHEGGTSVCRFRFEHDVDALLELSRRRFPHIPTMSAAAEKNIEAERLAEEAKLKKNLSPEAGRTLAFLREAKTFLESHQEAADRLAAAGRAARVGRMTAPSYKWAAGAIIALGAAAAAWGVYDSMSSEAGDGLWITLIGLAVIFLFAGSRVLPTGRFNRAALERELQDSRSAMERITAVFPGFPVPARYAHPAVLSRMIRSVRQGRAETASEAYEDMKAVLRETDASVRVTQEEYDEITAVKPLFLLEDYR